MNAKIRSRATTAFLAVLDRIAKANRDPTTWETACLYAALCALAVGDNDTAEQKISLCMLGELGQTPQVTLVPPPSIDDLREALHNLRLLFEQS